MRDSHRPKEVAEINDRSLRTLNRAITLSMGRKFSLILVRCNYSHLRQTILQQLREQCPPLEFRELELPHSAQKLFDIIKGEIENEQLPALMVLGLEQVSHLDNLLTATNQVRDEFRKHFQFPLVLWVTDEVQKKLLRLAPDFFTWAGVPISFLSTTDELIEFLRKAANTLFTLILQNSAGGFLDTSEFRLRYPRQELQSALRDLQEHQSLELDLEATVQFAVGRDDFASDKIDDAIAKYKQSLDFWQQTGNLERQGVLLFALGLCYRRQAELNRAENERYWKLEREYFQQCVDVFEQAQHPDLVAKFIGELGEVLQRLEEWDELRSLARKSLDLNSADGNSARIAQAYGFLATVALQDSNGEEAKRLAKQALQILEQASEEQRSRQGLYLLLLSEAQQQLNQLQEALQSLEKAKVKSESQDNPQLYIDILNNLQSLYYENKQYLKAFEIKQERQLVEGQYGFRAFIGAVSLQPKRGRLSEFQEDVAHAIAASGRQQDVERLFWRICRCDLRLSVIHGPSGVGKSSTVNAGLVPVLKQSTIEGRDILPLPLRFYNNWVDYIGQLLQKALEKWGECPLTPLDSGAAIIEQLKQNEYRNLFTVLIFDQFEEFFFVWTKPAERQNFFQFLSDCLNIPYVNVILSLREDYIHYLVQWERLTNLDVIDNDILSAKNRYRLSNFSPEDAKSIIKRLTERSQLHLESALVEQLVKDLAEDSTEVRPIELQIVGAQLQEENIKTLAEYQQFGTKKELIKRYLNSVVEDCGEENQQVAAYLVLYLLTDEKGTRPLKTRAELEADLEVLGLDLTLGESQLDLVLEILVKSGLVFVVPESPDDRYQLMHDYLVSLIRKKLPIEVAKQGAEAVRDYFRQQEEAGEETLYEAKLIIVGEGGAGKTTLARRIDNQHCPLPKEDESTKGIDVLKWHFPIGEGKDFHVNIWDFGGQEIYHTTHQFFLTKRSLYALVADSRKESPNLPYWLNIVELLSDNSPLLLIKNEKEDRPVQINESQLRGSFDNLKEFLPTNFADNNRGLNEIIESIKYHLKQLPHIGSTLPKTWTRVREFLEQDGRNYISLDEYLKICKDNDFKQTQDALQLSQFLHDIGVILHFQDSKISPLYRTVILKPEWGTEAVYKVLDNTNVVKNKGRFTETDLQDIWSDQKYSTMLPELLELMIKFKLCYPLPGTEDTYIAPQLLTSNKPNYDWDESNNLFLKYKYDFMPKGIILRFIVEMYRLIDEPNVWQTGVVFNREETQAEVIESYNRTELQIKLSGSNKKGFLEVITYKLDEIHESYHRLQVDKLVPCNCSVCHKTNPPTFFNFKNLKNGFNMENKQLNVKNLLLIKSRF